MVDERLCAHGRNITMQVGMRLGRLAEAAQVMRSAGFRTGAGEPLPAEWLRADDRTDLVAVYIDIAGMHGIDELLHPSLDARMQAEGEAIALAIDRCDHLVDLVSLES